MHAPRLVLWLSALGFAAFGTAFLAAPRPMASLVGIVLPVPAAVDDVRAVYGGMELGIGVFLGWCATRPSHLAVGLAASGWALGGAAAGRTLGIAIDGTGHPLTLGLLALEAVGSALSWWAYRRAAVGPV